MHRSSSLVMLSCEVCFKKKFKQIKQLSQVHCPTVNNFSVIPPQLKRKYLAEKGVWCNNVRTNIVYRQPHEILNHSSCAVMSLKWFCCGRYIDRPCQPKMGSLIESILVIWGNDWLGHSVIEHFRFENDFRLHSGRRKTEGWIRFRF